MVSRAGIEPATTALKVRLRCYSVPRHAHYRRVFALAVQLSALLTVKTGKDTLGRRGLDRIRGFIAVLECFIKKTPFSVRRKLYQPSASRDHYLRLLIRDVVRRTVSRGGDDCSIWICVSAIFALLERAPGAQSTIHAQSALALAGSASNLPHWPISSHDYRPAGAIQEFL
jgi:hypothetical protein